MVEPVAIRTWVGSDRGRVVAAVYLAVQGLLGIVWWIVLAASSAVREHFELMTDRRSGLDAFLVADAVIFIGGSLVAAAALWGRSRWATVIAAFTAGGAAYATLYLVEWVRLEGTAAASLVPMGLASVVTTAIAVGTIRATGGSQARIDDA